MFEIKKIKTDQQTYDKINDAIYNGSRHVAEHVYPFYRPVYNEDAGCYQLSTIDLAQREAMRRAVEYLKKRKREKEIKRNVTTGLLLLVVFILLVVLY